MEGSASGSGAMAGGINKGIYLINETERLTEHEENIITGLLLSIVSNNLISKNILSYLSFADMKTTRRVSNSFNDMITNSSRFQTRTVLCISYQTKQDLGELFASSKSCYKNVKIVLDGIKLELIDEIRFLLQNVEKLTLELDYNFAIFPGRVLGNIMSGILSDDSLNYSKLHIDVRLLGRSLNEVFLDSAVRNNLKNLRHFEIYKKPGESNEIFDPVWLTDEEKKFEPDKVFAKNLQHLAEALPSNQLEMLRLPQVETTRGNPDLFVDIIPTVLSKNRETLKELSAHLSAWRAEELKTISIPGLKKLTVSLNPEDQETLECFLNNHSSLEELDISVRKEFKRNLLESVKTGSKHLRKLHLKAKDFTEDTKVDWSFLRGMKHLEDFRIARPYNSEVDVHAYGNGPQILESLPRNQLKQLSFKGISECGFWQIHIYNAEMDDYNEMEPELSFKLDLLDGFKCLKRLSFSRCHDAVDDHVIQFILKEMKSLQEFEVSHCDYLTDAGIAGDPKDVNSVSIESLKGLKRLSILACEYITPEGLVSCLKLPILQFFRYSTEPEVTKSFIVSIAEQNPSLEVFATNFDDWIETKELLKELDHTRLTTLTPLMTEPNWAGGGSDSDADPPDYGGDGNEDGDSEFSGGGNDRRHLDAVLDEYDNDFDDDDLF